MKGQSRDDSEALRVAFEAADVVCKFIERRFDYVTEWRMSEVVCEASRFNYIWIETFKFRRTVRIVSVYFFG